MVSRDVRWRKLYVGAGSLASFFLLWHLGSVAFPAALPAPLTVVSNALATITTPGPRGHTGLITS